MPLKIAVFLLLLLGAPAKAHHYHHTRHNVMDSMMQNILERDRIEHRKYLLLNFNRRQLRDYDNCRMWAVVFNSVTDCTSYLY